MGITLHVLFWLVVVGALTLLCWLVSQAWGVSQFMRNLKLQQPDDPNNFLIIERVSGEYQAEETEVGPIKLAHRDSLMVGDKVLEMLSHSDLRTLSAAPISEELKNRVSQGDISDNLSPQRVRAAVAVMEIAMTLESLMQMFWRDIPNHKLFLILDERQTEMSIDGNKIRVGYVVDSFARKIEIGDGDWVNANYDEPEFGRYMAAWGIWEAVVALLREGKVRIPGLRAKPALAISHVITDKD